MSDIVLLHSLAILAEICFTIGLFLYVKSQISKNSEKLGGQKDDLITLKADFARLGSRFDTFNSSYYEDLLKKIATLTQDGVTLEHKVRGLDESVKNFYSKWARKLGNLAKKEREIDEADEMTTVEAPWSQMDLVTQAEQMNNKVPGRQTKKSNWPRRR